MARSKVAAKTTPSTEPEELRAKVLDAFKRPAAFCGLLDIIEKDGKRAKFRLNATQRRSLRQRTLRTLVLKARQIGQTTLELALDVHHFLTRPGASVVIVVQSIEGHEPRDVVSRRLEVMFESLERLGVSLPFVKRASTHWQLASSPGVPGATLRIIEAGASKAAAQKKGRAGTITRLHVTEEAFFEHADETLNALLECVPGPEFGSEIVIESTPNGAQGPFWRDVQKIQRGSLSGWQLQFFPWFESDEYRLPVAEGERVEPRTPRERELVETLGVTPEQLKWYQRKLEEKGSQDLLDQEYPSDPETCFLVSGRHFFDMAAISGLLAKANAPVVTQIIRATGVRQQIVDRSEVPAIRVWHRPDPRREYVVSCDTSEGSGGNAGCAVVIERGTGKHCATLWGQFKPWELAKWAVLLAKKYNWAWIVVERNNHGHTVLRSLDAEQRYPRIFHDRDKKPGWLTSTASRPMMLDTLEKALRAGHFETNDRMLLSQLRTFIVNAVGKPEAAKGADDDLVLGTGIGYDVVCRHVRKQGLGDEIVL